MFLYYNIMVNMNFKLLVFLMEIRCIFCAIGTESVALEA